MYSNIDLRIIKLTHKKKKKMKTSSLMTYREVMHFIKPIIWNYFKLTRVPCYSGC